MCTLVVLIGWMKSTIEYKGQYLKIVNNTFKTKKTLFPAST
jgi:hypothetical protein